MPTVDLVAYQDDDGTVPLLEWFDGLAPKARAKCGVRLERLARTIHEDVPQTPRFDSCRRFSGAGPAGDLEQVVEDAGVRKVPAGAERAAKPPGRGVWGACS